MATMPLAASSRPGIVVPPGQQPSTTLPPLTNPVIVPRPSAAVVAQNSGNFGSTKSSIKPAIKSSIKLAIKSTTKLSTDMQ